MTGETFEREATRSSDGDASLLRQHAPSDTYGTCHDHKPPPSAPTPATSTSTSHKAAAFTREQKLLLGCLGTGSLLGGCLLALMVPFFPVEARGRGVSQTVTSAVFSCYAATQLVVFPLSGRLVPRLGVSRSYCLGLAVAGGSTVAFGVLPWLADTRAFVAASFATRMVEAVGVSVLSTACLTVIANQFQERTNTAAGVVGTLGAVGFSLGPAIGGGLYYVGGYGLPFYALGVLMLVTAGITLAVMPAVGRPQRHSGRVLPILRALAGSGEVWLCCLLLLTVSMNWSTISPGIGPYAFAAIGITPSQLGLFFLVATGAFSVFSILWGAVHDRVHNTYLLMTPCLVLAAVGLLLLSPSPLLPLQPSWWLLGIGMTAKEVAQGGTFVPLFPKVLHVCLARGLEDTVDTHAFVSSMFWAAFSIGNVVGPMVGGVIIDECSFPVLTTVLAGWTLAVAALSAVQAVRVWCRHESTVVTSQPHLLYKTLE